MTPTDRFFIILFMIASIIGSYLEQENHSRLKMENKKLEKRIENLEWLWDNSMTPPRKGK